MRSADVIVDIGPGAGAEGGYILSVGPIEDILNNPKSLTGAYLSGRQFIAIPKKRRTGALDAGGEEREGQQPQRHRRRHSARHVHLRDRRERQRQIDAGQRGRRQGAQPAPAPSAGRRHVRQRQRRGRTRQDGRDRPIADRPHAAVQSGHVHRRLRFGSRAVLDDARSKLRGYTPGRFSFNVKGGRCEACQGDGIIKIEMHFLPDVYVPCEVCKGKRYNAQTLEVKYKGKSIADILEMRVDEAAVSVWGDSPHRQQAQDDRRGRLGLHQDGPAGDAAFGR